MLELAQLKRFVTVVETGSFVAAADQLGITQQALSTSIMKMEKEAGVRLLDRKQGAKIHLTVFGSLMLERGRAQLEYAERTLREVHSLRDSKSGQVVIGIGETMLGPVLSSAVAHFHSENPQVQIGLVEGYTEQLVDRLLIGEFDFVAGAPSNDLRISHHLEQRYLFDMSDILAVRRAHPLAQRGNVTLRDLQMYTWMVPRFRTDAYTAVTTAYLKQKLDPPTRIIQSDTIAVGRTLILQQDYILMTSPDLIDVPPEIDALIRLDIDQPTVVRHACLIARRGMSLTPVARRLMDEIEVSAKRSQRTKRGGRVPAVKRR